MSNSSEDTLQKGYIVAALALICCFLWGSAFPCVKIGYSMFSIAPGDTASQILFAGSRFFLAGLLTIVIGSLISRRPLIPAKSSWGMTAVLSFAQTSIQYTFFYIGLANTSGVKGSIISASNVFIAILFSSLVFHYERLGRSKILGCILGFAGVVIINLSGNGPDSSMSFTGEGFIFLSTVSYAISSVLVKKYSQKENPLTLSGWQFIIGGLTLIAAGLLMGGRLTGFTFKSSLLLLYMAVISAAAYSIWSVLLKHNPVGRVAVFGFLTPVMGVILSALILHEQNQAFTLSGLISLLLVCTGIYLVNSASSVDKA